ncbi:MAG: RNase adapter RapZ [Polyangia bacterium]
MRIIIVTGVSGAGKSTALRALEDAGYFCVDNLPLPLMNRFVELLSEAGETEQAAVGVDAREGEFLSSSREVFAALRSEGHQLEVLFLDADDDVLVRRFSETRRRHPLSGDDLREGIAREREILRSLREEASAYVDTANLNVHQLKGVIHERYRRSAGVLAVTLLSFGFKHGLPAEADMVLDVRFLPNPYFVEALSASTGEEANVREFVLGNDDATGFLERSQALLEFVLPRAEREGKAYLTVAVGCTGGRHRSVAVVQELAKRLPRRHPLTVRHRDLARGRE